MASFLNLPLEIRFAISALARARNIWTEICASFSSPTSTEAPALVAARRNAMIGQLNSMIPSAMEQRVQISFLAPGFVPPGSVLAHDTFLLIQGLDAFMNEIADFAANSGKLRISHGRRPVYISEFAMTTTVTFPIIDGSPTLTRGNLASEPPFTTGNSTSTSFGPRGLR